MRGFLVMLSGALIFALGVACESSDAESAPAAQVADLSQFPTPTRSQAEPRPTAQPLAAQPQPGQAEVDADEATPMTPEEMQRLRQRLQSGELSEEEAQQAIQRLRAQFGGGQGGPPFEGNAGSVAVGAIESVGEDAITIKTELASVTSMIGESANVRVTSILERAALTDGAQVLVVGERIEGNALARVITIFPEGQTGFRGGQGGRPRFGADQGSQAVPGGGQGVRSLFGAVEGVTDAGFTLETQQGPLPIALDDESVVVRTRQGTIADLKIGMVVRVVGPSDEDGAIDARSVVVTPEELQDIPGFGGGGRN